MGLDFDALVLGPCMDAFANTAIVSPAVSQPGAAPYLVRGVFALKGADITADDDAIVRADDYTFGVRASEFSVVVACGDLVSEIDNITFRRFLEGRTFLIHDTGDDGQGGQTWVLKEQRVEDDEP